MTKYESYKGQRNFPIKREKVKDPRNYLYHEHFKSVGGILPTEVDLTTTGYFTNIKDQGRISSCSAFGVGSVIEYIWNSKYKDLYDISELYQYYFTRQREGKTKIDSGAYIINAVKTPFDGFVAERFWPYDIMKFADLPSWIARLSAIWNKSLLTNYAYYEVYSTEEVIKQVLADGNPVVFGAQVYTNFLTNNKGYADAPGNNDKLVGGHCMVIVGYITNPDGIYWKVRNSWGLDWGAHGYTYISESFRQKYCFDFYTIKQKV